MLQRRCTALLVLGLMLMPATAPLTHAQGSMPADFAAKVAAIGAVINPPETAKLYGPLQEKEPYQGVKVTRGIKYGPDDRNILDVFAPEQPAAGPRPVLIFIHGGGFVAGNKRAPGSPFYDNIMLFAARSGLVGVNATYRLAPQNPWPAAAQDLGSAVRWVNENVASHGGDPARVTMMGHSAGAVHVATYVAHSAFHGPKGIGLAGAILLSGLYDIAAVPPGGPESKYYGEDRSKYAERSSLAGLTKAAIPLMVAYAELDPDFFHPQAKQLNEALCKAGRCPRFLFLPNHSHMSEVYAFNTKDTVLSDPVLAFVKGSK